MHQHKGELLPDTEILVGDLVMISRNDPMRSVNPMGTVVQKTNYSITAAFDSPQSFIFGKGLRMDLYVNDITYQRIKDVLQQLEGVDYRLAEIRDTLAGIDAPRESENEKVSRWFNKRLNDSQKQAVEFCFGAKDCHLIHGLPGTGKTTTAIEVIEQAMNFMMGL